MPSSSHDLSRRHFLMSAASLSLVSACSPLRNASSEPRDLIDSDARLLELERRTGGRIGVAALNLQTGAQMTHRADERFAMCSTFKWLLAAAVLHRVDRGTESLDTTLTWSADDLVTWSPVTKPMVEARNDGVAHMTIGELCQATLRTSDNTAANVVLKSIGGPAALTADLRVFGDNVTRLDRTEPELNANTPGDPRDTSTPTSMLWLMEHVLYKDILSVTSRRLLKNWLIANKTGAKRLRAGLPADWTVGDRTGTSTNNANNAIAFAEAPTARKNEGPLLIVSFTNAPNPTSEAASAHHADIAELVFNALI